MQDGAWQPLQQGPVTRCMAHATRGFGLAPGDLDGRLVARTPGHGFRVHRRLFVLREFRLGRVDINDPTRRDPRARPARPSRRQVFEHQRGQQRDRDRPDHLTDQLATAGGCGALAPPLHDRAVIEQRGDGTAQAAAHLHEPVTRLMRDLRREAVARQRLRQHARRARCAARSRGGRCRAARCRLHGRGEGSSGRDGAQRVLNLTAARGVAEDGQRGARLFRGERDG